MNSKIKEYKAKIEAEKVRHQICKKVINHEYAMDNNIIQISDEITDHNLRIIVTHIDHYTPVGKLPECIYVGEVPSKDEGPRMRGYILQSDVKSRNGAKYYK